MVFENIEYLQRQWTDKFVVVDPSRPELKRFDGMTGVVKTVNFSGRALVEFDANNNIGWFDIDPKFLKVIDAPLAKPAKEAKAEKKAAPAKVEKPAEAKAAAKPAAGGASVADILAAARAGKSAAPAADKPAAKPAMNTADILAAARGKAAAPAAEKPAAPKVEAAPAKVEAKAMSTADILAMARGQKAAAAPAAKPVAPAPVEAPVAVEEPAAAPEPEEVAETTTGSSDQPVKVDRSKMDVDAMVAYCRKVDAKG
jgi:hypothetical protein